MNAAAAHRAGRADVIGEVLAGAVAHADDEVARFRLGLADTPDGRVLRTYPMVPGIDLAGAVTESRDARFQAGDEVLITGYDLGVGHFGGFAQVARVPADWVVKLPAGLTPREAMALGT